MINEVDKAVDLVLCFRLKKVDKFTPFLKAKCYISVTQTMKMEKFGSGGGI